MIIEDDALMSDVYVSIIRSFFDDVEINFCFCVDDVIETVTKNTDKKWDIYICDLRIPTHKGSTKGEDVVFNGFEVIENYLLPCRTIIISGYLSPEIGAKARELGIAAIYQKPPNINALTITINFIFKYLP
jgi:DNA-binding NarL/FixJ family response regulator